ncbi:MAG: serine aminopeptidase domain-containing protein, partial [Woeseiaceae bacterium]
LGIFTTAFLAPRTQFATPIEPEMFTTTPEYLAYIKADPLRLHDATARFFMTSRALDSYVERNVIQNKVPVLLYLAGNDRIIDNDGVVEILNKSQEPVEIIEYTDQTHSIQFDASARMVGDMLQWLRLVEPADGD